MSPSRTGRKTSEASLPSNAASGVQYRGVCTERNAPARVPIGFASFSLSPLGRGLGYPAPLPPSGGRGDLLGNPRDRVDLDIDARAGRSGLDGGARRLNAREVLFEGAVERREVLHVAQVHAHAHDVDETGAAGLEHGPDIVERHARLLGDVRGDDGLRRGIERALAGNEQEAPASHPLGDGRLGAFREACLGRRFGEDHLGFHARVSPLSRAATSSGNGRAWSRPPALSGSATHARTSKPVAQRLPFTDTSCSTRNVFSRTSVTVDRIVTSSP